MSQHEPEERVFQGRRFDVVRLRQTDEEGSEHIRDVVRHPGAVAIVPVLADGRICLLKNYRAAVGKTLIELPAGTLELGEAPLETARRELAEETGYRAGAMELLTTFYTSPGVLDERMYVYRATELVEGRAAPEPGEDLRPFLAAPDEIRAMIRQGAIEDGKTLAGLLYHAALGQERR